MPRVMPSDYKVRHLTPIPAAGALSPQIDLKSVKTTKVPIETLSHATTCAKRNNHLQNSCIHMLKNGYHRAYTEIFNLVENRRKERELAGPGSEMSLEVILEDNTSYIDKLKHHLCEAEKNERSKNHGEVYSNISQLAIYFDEEKLHWLAHHFYTRALEVAHNVRLDSGKSLCEASEKCGIAAESRNDLESARKHLEEARKICKGRASWKQENGDSWHEQISNHLSRVLRNLAAGKSDVEGLDLLEKSVLAADESHKEITIATANYHLGSIQFNLKQFQDAQKSLLKALNNAVKIKNEKLIQMLTTKLASLTRETGSEDDQLDKAKDYLKLAVDNIKEEVESSVDALSQVALLYNAYGEYENAQKSIQEAYLACGQAGGRELSTRVSSGTISGNMHFPSFRRILAASTEDKSQVRRLVDWKNQADNSLLED